MPTLSLFLSQLFNGLAFGSLLALVSVGLTIILGTLGVLNFAHGAMFMVGAYAGYVVMSATGSFLLAVLVGSLFVLGLGILIERGLIRYFYWRTPEDQILLTFGIGIILVEFIRIIFGGIAKRVSTPSWAGGVTHIGPLIYPEYRIVVIGIALVTLVALYILLYRTTLGLIVRAGIEDALMVRMLGINVSKSFLAVFAIGSMAAGFAGVIYSPISAATPDMGFRILVISFVVVVIGGLGSFPGAVVGGLIAGAILSLTSMFNSAYSDAMLFAVMALVLILRPSGLFGVEGRQ